MGLVERCPHLSKPDRAYKILFSIVLSFFIKAYSSFGSGHNEDIMSPLKNIVVPIKRPGICRVLLF